MLAGGSCRAGWRNTVVRRSLLFWLDIHCVCYPVGRGKKEKKKKVVFSDGFIQSGHIRQSFHQMVHVHHAYGKQRELNLERDSVFLSKYLYISSLFSQHIL